MKIHPTMNRFTIVAEFIFGALRFRRMPEMTTIKCDFQYNRLKLKLEKEIANSQKLVSQKMPDKVWENEERRMEWIREDRPQWNYNNSRLNRLKRLYDKCFPQMEWVVTEIEAFYRAEEGPIY